MSFRAWVRTLLNQMTQEALAEKWHVAQPTIAQYKAGTRRPDRERCILISEAEEEKSLAEIIEMVQRDAGGDGSGTARVM